MLKRRALSLFGMIVLPVLAHASTISIQPSTSAVNIGDLFSLTIVGSAFSVAPDGGGISLVWNPAVLKLGPSAFTLSSVWVSPSTTGVAGSGSLNNIFLFDNTAPASPFNIGTIQFQALAAGVSSVSVSEAALNPFAGGGARITDLTFVNSTVTVTGPQSVIPEPQSAALVAGALALVALGFRQRRKRGLQL